MIDATNVGISPLMSTPMTTSFVTTPGVGATQFIPGVQDVSPFTTGAEIATGLPATIGTQVMDPGLLGGQVIDQGLVGGQVMDPNLLGAQVVDPGLLGGQVIDQGLVGGQIVDPGLLGGQVIDQGLVGGQIIDPGLLGGQVIDQGLVGGQIVDPNLALTGATTSLITDPTSLMQVPSPDLQGIQYLTNPGVPQPVVDPLLLSTAGGLTGSTLPPVTSPEFISANPLAQTTGSYAASALAGTPTSLSQPTGYGSATMGGTPVPPPPMPQAPPAPQAPIGPIMDEDFQRGRPIYDEFSEDRYRGFRLGA